jgi:hypothetical protein
VIKIDFFFFLGGGTYSLKLFVYSLYIVFLTGFDFERGGGFDLLSFLISIDIVLS